MIISTEVENVFDKIQHPFMIKKKTLGKLGIEGNIFILIKNIYKKFYNYVLHEEKLLLIQKQAKKNFRFSPLLFNTSYALKQPPSKIKYIQIGKEEVKLSLFTDDTIIQIKKFQVIKNEKHLGTNEQP